MESNTFTDHSQVFLNPFSSQMVFSSPLLDHSSYDQIMASSHLLPATAHEEHSMNTFEMPRNNDHPMLLQYGYNEAPDASLANLLSSVGNSTPSPFPLNIRSFMSPRVHPSYRVGGSSLPCWDRSENYHMPKYELSLSLGSSSDTPYSVPPSDIFSMSMLSSRYLHVVQEILVEFTNYALGTSDELDDSICGVSPVASFDEFTPSRESPPHEDSTATSQLLDMIQMIDHRYNDFLDQIHKVVAVFHDIASLSSRKMTARFALHTVSSICKNLKEQITRHLSSQECSGKYQSDFESSFIRKKWALQQLGTKDQQSWRPQRGLPERSVSVLKAWMFQNFLHPYPKDRDKHFLAIQSGLTRNQVSNWFINARVRLWKPMIEEMYSEIKKHQTGQVIQGGDFGNHLI